jgi:hypothetical protein
MAKDLDTEDDKKKKKKKKDMKKSKVSHVSERIAVPSFLMPDSLRKRHPRAKCWYQCQDWAVAYKIHVSCK